MSSARARGAVATRRRSYLYGSILLLAGVLYGFSFTYWRPVLRGDGFPALVHVHAALWFGWFALLAVQVFLVNRIKLVGHRRLGFAIVAYTAVLVGASLLLAVQTIVRDAPLVLSGVDAVPTIIPKPVTGVSASSPRGSLRASKSGR